MSQSWHRDETVCIYFSWRSGAPRARAQTLEWIEQLSSSDGTGVSVDALGNVYLSGKSKNYDDAFIAKYDVNGSFQWIQAISSTGAVGNGVSVDALGNAYETGINGVNAFLAKYDANGGTSGPSGLATAVALASRRMGWAVFIYRGSASEGLASANGMPFSPSMTKAVRWCGRRNSALAIRKSAMASRRMGWEMSTSRADTRGQPGRTKRWRT